MLPPIEGLLIIDKPKGKTSFSLISLLRKILNIKTIGHAGTLDPMATGVMVLLIGKKFTTLSDQFLHCDKEYVAEITLGVTTDTYDAEGTPLKFSEFIPSPQMVTDALTGFQGTIQQVPPMFSAKKVKGKKLYELARQGQEIPREPVSITLTTCLESYVYPKVKVKVRCSKGTYIRSIAYDLGELLGCGAHLSGLIRTQSGDYVLKDCVSGDLLFTLPLEEARQEVLKNLRSKL